MFNFEARSLSAALSASGSMVKDFILAMILECIIASGVLLPIPLLLLVLLPPLLLPAHLILLFVLRLCCPV